MKTNKEVLADAMINNWNAVNELREYSILVLSCISDDREGSNATKTRYREILFRAEDELQIWTFANFYPSI